MPQKTCFDKKAEEDDKNIFTNKHTMVFENSHNWLAVYFNTLIFEPDTMSIEHTLPVQRRLIIIDMRRLIIIDM